MFLLTLAKKKIKRCFKNYVANSETGTICALFLKHRTFPCHGSETLKVDYVFITWDLFTHFFGLSERHMHCSVL